MMNKRLAIFGPYPPPLGGISVHIMRLETFLEAEGIFYRIYNHGEVESNSVIATRKKVIWYLKMFFVEPYQIFHFHQFFYFHFIYYCFFSLFRNEKIVVTIHSERLLEYSSLKKKIALFFLSKTSRLSLISVSKNLNEFLLKNGVNSKFLPAYIPPQGTFNKAVNCDKDLFLFSVWKFNKKLADEIYNVPLAFEFLSKHKSEFSMLFMIGNKKDSDLVYLDELISEYNIGENIILVFDENLIDYVHNCIFLLRANISDGYGVSIQEAMDLGVPAIASDVCERPKGAILFKSNDLKDLTEKVAYVRRNSNEELLLGSQNLTYHLELLNLYNSLFDK